MKDYIGIKEKYDIRLNSNESYIDMNKEIMIEMKSCLLDIQLHRYPENDMLKIKELYGAYADTQAENIIVGNGSDEMLELIISSLMGTGKKMLTLSPDFVMYDFYVSLFGGEVKKYKLNNNINFTLDDFIKLGIKEDVDLIMFSNPNNPTGLALAPTEIIKILEAFPDKTVVVDEAYYEFYGKSMIPYINTYKNLIVTRTLSKAWGLAALRVGFLISNLDNVKKLLEKKIPYTVNSYSQAMVITALKYPYRVIKNSKQIIEQREILSKELKLLEKNASMNIKFYSSKANFIFGRTLHKEALLNGLSDKGILIRDFPDDTFRITIGSPLENKKLIDGLKEIFIYEGAE
ncbi:histidinol-phosphate transaminase [Clostridium uliginosum]|uniref:Histidinol-phosphate aminotransferase n=1 Tax=Clostridium uliginosum TaxID=119641 RepID=A0A1I1LVK3_9CLOT|nr:histidinol-phosphate transaminase [Clostridium uliginosum]SFC77121.1 histidinol-phosphate aminotransferase [Clostridium uliginosum]